MLWHIYLSKRTVFIPSVSKTEAGFYLDTEPVEVVPAQDVSRLELALKTTIERGNPIVPTPTRDKFPEPVVLKYAKKKSWASFEKSATCFIFAKRESIYEIKHLRNSPNGGWEDDPDNIETVSLDAGIDVAVKKMIAMVLRSIRS